MPDFVPKAQHFCVHNFGYGQDIQAFEKQSVSKLQKITYSTADFTSQSGDLGIPILDQTVS